MPVGPIDDDDERLAMMADLAQRNSFQAGTGERRLGLAFGTTPAEAELLADILVVPDDTHLLVVKGNAVLLYPPTAEDTFVAATDCLDEDG